MFERMRRVRLSRKRAIIAVLAAAVAILLVAVVFWSGWFSPPPRTPTGLPLIKDVIPGGRRWGLSGGYMTDSKAAWSDLQVQLSDGGSTITWGNMSNAALTSRSPPATWHYGTAKPFGNLSVWFNVTDLNGDGKYGGGFYFDFTAGGQRFNATRQYTVSIMYTPTGSAIVSGASLN